MTNQNQDPVNLLEISELYIADIRAKKSEKTAQNSINEFNSMFRTLIEALGFNPENPNGRWTSRDQEMARTYVKKINFAQLAKLPLSEMLRAALRKKKPSQASFNTYAARGDQFISWVGEQSWWPKKSQRHPRRADKCCPPRERPFGHRSNTPLRDAPRPEKYGLPHSEMTPPLQAECEAFQYHLKFKEKLKPRSIESYLADTALFLGYLANHQDPPVPVEQLSLQSLLPLVTAEELDELSPTQRKRLWRKLNQTLTDLIHHYFQFLEEHQNSRSPRTKVGRLVALYAIGRFIYKDEADSKAEMRLVPIIATILEELRVVQKVAKEWTVSRKYVSDYDKKWPEVPEGMTELRFLRERFIERLAPQCRVRDPSGRRRAGWRITASIGHLLIWLELIILAPRRQQELRDRKVSTSCPVKRPDDVPADGLYHPLPPDWAREIGPNQLPADIYLYRTYTDQGKHYPEGIWVADVQDYKTRQAHGCFSGILPNYRFSDGTSFYDYVERYLYGSWFPGTFKTAYAYQWCDPIRDGQKGVWQSLGLLELEPEIHQVTGPRGDTWTHTVVFVQPGTGKPYGQGDFSNLYADVAHSYLGRRITSHTMRYIWATWAFMVGLSEHQLRALAAQMGMTVETMRRTYEQRVPAEQRRIVQEAVDKWLLDELSRQEDTDSGMLSLIPLDTLKRTIQQLSTKERQQLLDWIASLAS